MKLNMRPGLPRKWNNSFESDVIPICRLAAWESKDCPYRGQLLTTFVEWRQATKGDIRAQEEVR
jgi:hypothetical protein